MEFSRFMEHFTANAKKIFESNENLFLVNIEKDVLWNTYLDSFPSEFNKVYRVRREMDCSCCKSFIRAFGNVVAIVDNKIVSFWDFSTEDESFNQMLKKMSKLVKSASVSDVFVNKQLVLGTEKSRELLDTGEIQVWNHFHITIPRKFITTLSASVNELSGIHRDIKNVFKRSLDEISPDSVQQVLDLISEKILYRGEEWNAVLDKFSKLQKTYLKLKTKSEKENFCWVKSVEVGGSVGKIRNHSIGTLLVNISEGMDIEEAIRKYEVIVAPTNYKRPKAVFTKKMVEDAQNKIIELGLENSLGRRYAVISDITINNVLWANRNAQKAMKGKNVFDELKEEVAVNPTNFKDIQGISIEAFLEKLPTVKQLEILFENRNQGNLFSLIAPIDKESPSLFKWNNPFSWSYKGNIADSMKERVKSAGGKVDGVLRFSLQWNTDERNLNDYDAHCTEPNGNEIYYSNKGQVHRSSGVLDVDIIHPIEGKPAVENITWSERSRMQVGKHILAVHNFSHNGGTSGFDAEVEFDGQIYEFSYHKNLKNKETVVVAEVMVDKNGNFSIKECLPSSTSSRTIWNLKTNQFLPVSVFMFSPNYWDEQKGNGNRHYFFILSGCKNDSNPNGFYNEYLNEDLMKHKKVFEALGSKMKVEDSENQLSGVGFSSTKRDYVIAKVDGIVTKIIF